MGGGRLAGSVAIFALGAAAVASAKPPAPAEYVGECPTRERTVRVVAAFQHGHGMDQKQWLDRDHATAILRRELAIARIPAPATDVVLRSVKRLCDFVVPPEQRQYIQDGTCGASGPLRLDGFEVARRIGFVFLSAGDARAVAVRNYERVDDLGGDDDSRWHFANDVAHRAGLDPAVEHLGVFYDPGAATVKESEDLLRAQVRDFVACLRLAGVR